MICRVLAMEMLQGVWKQHLRPRAVVGYGLKIFLPSPPNYVTRSPGMHSAQSQRLLPIKHRITCENQRWCHNKWAAKLTSLGINSVFTNVINEHAFQPKTKELNSGTPKWLLCLSLETTTWRPRPRVKNLL